MIFAMQVYVEFALLENFCMDFCLLYGAKLLSRNATKTSRLILPSVVGAIIAVIFPLLNLNGIFSFALKTCSAFVVCACLKNFNCAKSYFFFCAIFIILTFLLGGALIAVFSLVGVEYAQGRGYIISSVPIGIPLFFALALILACRVLAKKYKPKASDITLTLTIINKKYRATERGFFDSGNNVYYRGCPVIIVPYYVAEQVVDVKKVKGKIAVHTVAGTKVLPVFFVDEILIENAQKTSKFSSVAVAVGESLNGAIVHTDFLGDFL